MIIGISGRKQSGKNSACNFIAGEILKTRDIVEGGGLISEYRINDFGELVVPAQVSETSVADGVLDLQLQDPAFVKWANEFVFPYTKIYSFAFFLKKIAVDVFGVTPHLIYGTDEQKNEFTHIDRAVLKRFGVKKKIGQDEPEFLTGREFLQFLGTEVFRKIWSPVWCKATMNMIVAEQSETALVCDVRFPEEVEIIKNNGGKVIRLLRSIDDSSHESEVALDKYEDFDLVIDNRELSLLELGEGILSYVRELEVVK